MRPRIICPFHKERTPSCILYADSYHCFACGAHGPLSDVGMAGEKIPEPEPEDLAKSLEYIVGLPKKPIRGLSLHADAEGYYVVWPDCSYYKKRFFVDRGCKYFGARGHKKPWFWAAQGNGDALVVVEGELNALSIAAALPELDVVSPGGVGDFTSKRVKKHLQLLVQYSTVLIVADADAPGAKAVIELYGELAGKVPTVKTLLMPVDANEIVEVSGIEVLREKIQGAMGSSLAEGA